MGQEPMPTILGSKSFLLLLIMCIFMAEKIYMTVNTLLKDQEVEELYKYLMPYYCQGLDAVIVQDTGALSLIQGMVSGSWNPYQHTDDSDRDRGQNFFKAQGQKELFRQEN